MSNQKPEYLESLTRLKDNSAALEYVIETSSAAMARAIIKFHPYGERLSAEQMADQARSALEIMLYESLSGERESDVRAANPIETMFALRERALFDEHRAAFEPFLAESLQYRKGLLGELIAGDSVLDIGCGGGALLRELKKERGNLELYGIDPYVTEPPPGVEFSPVNLFAGEEAPWRADTVFLLHVLHHTGDNEERLLAFLKRAKAAANRRLVIIEDVMLDSADVAALARHDESLIDNDSLEAFIAMEQQQQKTVLSILDLMINVGIFGLNYMPFPFYFKSVAGWRKVFDRDGWQTTEILPDRIFKPATYFHGPYAVFVVERRG